MQSVVQLITETGVLLVIVGIFLWNTITTSKNMEKLLAELREGCKLQTAAIDGLKHTTENTTTALNIIQNTLAGVSQALERHDKRSEYMNNDMREVTTLIKNRPCIYRDGDAQNGCAPRREKS